MSYPTKYTRQYGFQAYQDATPNRPLPGDKVDFDLNAVVVSIDEIVEFLKLHARSDGKLLNGVVTVESLSAELAGALGVGEFENAASGISFTPGGNISATNVQSAINELDTEKAPLSHAHAAGDITSGTLADARISQSSVTQHAAAVLGAADSDDLPNASDVAGSNVSDALDALAEAINEIGIPGVESVFGRGPVVVAEAGDYAASEVSNDSGVTGSTVADALDNLETAISGAGAVASVFGRTGAVVAASSDYDAVQVDFTPTGNIAATNVQAAIVELDTAISSAPLDVKSFGAVGDNSTDDQTAVAAAVAAAYAAGTDLRWPAGTYVTTGSIPNFHDVKHYGPGVVKRGSNLFYISAQNGRTNHLFVSASGSATDDGLSASQPGSSIQTGINRIKAWPVNKAAWVLNLAAGSYSEVVTMYRFQPESLITIQGPDVSNGTPTAIIDGTFSPSSTAIGVYQCGGAIIFHDILVQDFTSGGGFYFRNSTCYFWNVHVNNCKTGIGYSEHANFLPDDYCRVDCNNIASSIGIYGLYNVSHDMTGTSSESLLIENCNEGIVLAEGATGHLDYVRIHDCTTGLVMARCDSGANTKDMQIYRCTTGVFAKNSNWFNNGIDFGLGTANACTVAVKTAGSAPEFDWRCQDYTSLTERLMLTAYSGMSHTGDTNETTIWTPLTLRQGTVPSPSMVRMSLIARPTLTTSTGRIRVYLDDDEFTSVLLPSGTTLAHIEVEIHFSGTSSQRGIVKAVTAAGTVLVSYGTCVKTPNSADIPIYVKTTLGHAGDTMDISAASIWTTIGG